MKKMFFALCFLVFSGTLLAQKRVAFTIDDVPNARLYQKEEGRCRLLETIDSLSIPVAIFINEQRIFSGDSIEQTVRLFNKWISDPLVTLGNHGFQHAHYSTLNPNQFKEEVLKGSYLTKELARKFAKAEKYFRFPYNDLGKNAAQQLSGKNILDSLGFITTPFTVHSEDWFVTELYQFYKDKKMYADADKVAEAFINKTIDYFDYIDSLTTKNYKRSIAHIYLLHDVLLNADLLAKLVDRLKKLGYAFITLDEAMNDPVYKSENYFYESPGISWVYRWVKDPALRRQLINSGPNIHQFEEEMKSAKSLK